MHLLATQPPYCEDIVAETLGRDTSVDKGGVDKGGGGDSGGGGGDASAPGSRPVNRSGRTAHDDSDGPRRARVSMRLSEMKRPTERARERPHVGDTVGSSRPRANRPTDVL